MLNFIYSFHILGFTYILLKSEGYFLLVTTHVVLLGLIRIFWWRTTVCNEVEISTWKCLGFSVKATSKAIDTTRRGDFKVIFTVMIYFQCMTCVFRLYEKWPSLTEARYQKMLCFHENINLWEMLISISYVKIVNLLL